MLYITWISCSSIAKELDNTFFLVENSSLGFFGKKKKKPVCFNILEVRGIHY